MSSFKLKLRLGRTFIIGDYTREVNFAHDLQGDESGSSRNDGYSRVIVWTTALRCPLMIANGDERLSTNGGFF